MSAPVVIIGTGLAGYNLAREFRKLDTQTPLLLITADDGRSYSKPLLSTGFAANKNAESLGMATAGAMAEQLNAEIRIHTRVTRLDPANRRVWIGNEPVSYRDLVRAWGAQTIQVPVAGDAADAVFPINDLHDYGRFRAAVAGKRRVLILGAGLAKASSKGKKPYDTFRNRIMFPIRDPRGRCIAFGGRAMDPNDNAKYLNSPETELFDKGRSLYNQGPAREAAGKGKPLVVAEGYMDVIALSEAGFGATVAPLGTAITESQLQLLWRIAPEPVIALDGDTAGLRAAMRVIDLALPLLEAGKSLRFALMPEGLDPDDLIRAQGPVKMQTLLDAAIPMVDLLWRRETEGRNFDSPERKATLDKALRDKIKLIRDPSIRAHYGQAIKDLRWDLFRQNRRKAFVPGKPFQPGQGRGGRRGDFGPAFNPGTKSSMLVSAGDTAQTRLREAVILATLVRQPDLIAEFDYQIDHLDCADPDFALLRDRLLDLSHHDDIADLEARLPEMLGPGVLENLYSLPHVAIAPSVRRSGDTETARMTVTEEFAKLQAERGLSAEIAEAEEELGGVADEAVTWRLHQAAETKNRALRSEQEDKSRYDIGKNGARINRDERDALDRVLGQISFTKRPR